MGFEGAGGDIRHHQVADVPVLTVVEHGQDVGVLQVGDHFGFPLDAVGLSPALGTCQSGGGGDVA